MPKGRGYGVRRGRRLRTRKNERKRAKKGRKGKIPFAQGEFERPKRKGKGPKVPNPNRFKGRLRKGKGLPPGIAKKMGEASQVPGPGAAAREAFSRSPKKLPKAAAIARRMKKVGGTPQVGGPERAGSAPFGTPSYKRPQRGPKIKATPPGRGVSTIARNMTVPPGHGGTPPGLVNKPNVPKKLNAIKRRRGGRF